MAVLVLFVDLRRVVAISTFAILFYYAIANFAAFKLKTEHRRYHKVLHALGLITCLVLLVFILFAQTTSWTIGAVCLIIGALYYVARKRFQKL
jgi:APA family basic amino acid/polyamine antiporter